MIDGERILAVGPVAEVRATADAASRSGSGGDTRSVTTLDARQCLILPGFVNPHWHEGLARRAQALGMPLSDHADPVSPFARGGDIHALSQNFDALYSWHEKMTPQESEAFARYALWAQLRSGTTTVGDVGSVAWPEALVGAARTVGLRAALSVWASDALCLPGETAFTRTRDADAVLARIEEQLLACGADGTGRIRGMPSAVYTANLSDELAEGIVALALRHDTPVATHLGALPNESGVVREYFGRTPVRRFAELGLLTDRLIAVHCAYADLEEWAMLRGARVHISHSPAKYGLSGESTISGSRMIVESWRAGQRVSLSTDGEAQQIGGMPEAMRQAWLGHNEIWADNTAVRPSDALLMATRFAADGLRWSDQIGSLEPGKLADLVLIDTDDWRYTLCARPLEIFLKVGGSADVDTVIVGGEVLVRGGRPTRFEEEQVTADFVTAAYALAKRQGWPVDRPSGARTHA